jgi:hypothetical protein
MLMNVDGGGDDDDDDVDDDDLSHTQLGGTTGHSPPACVCMNVLCVCVSVCIPCHLRPCRVFLLQV